MATASLAPAEVRRAAENYSSAWGKADTNCNNALDTVYGATPGHQAPGAPATAF